MKCMRLLSEIQKPKNAADLSPDSCLQPSFNETSQPPAARKAVLRFQIGQRIEAYVNDE